jgi:hypothetical protein
MMCTCSQCVADRNSKFASIGQGLDIVNVQSVQQGINLYRAFNCFGPSRVRTVDHSRVIPPIVVELGELVGLMYRSDKGQLGQPRTYIHQMEDPPRLVSNIEGTQLYIVGGSYQVTPRGIEG